MIDKLDLIRKRGFLCEYCYKERAIELHHCLLHRMAGRLELDVEENLACVCHRCHTSGAVNGYKFRCTFWLTQCNRYGLLHMRSWLASLHLRATPRFE
uniref:Uncharacterized protein n=1 Tax=viral metagenome TaxID=1070528 RepID=A0A6H1ZAV3_9ZZZZ